MVNWRVNIGTVTVLLVDRYDSGCLTFRLLVSLQVGVKVRDAVNRPWFSATSPNTVTSPRRTTEEATALK